MTADSMGDIDFETTWPELIEGDYGALVGYARILWPSFVEHADCIFISGRFVEKNYDGFMAQTGGDRAAVESVMNHIHVLDLFASEPQPSRQLALYLGQLIKETWTAKLLRDFPDRKFSVSFHPDEHCDDLIQYEVTFFQSR